MKHTRIPKLIDQICRTRGTQSVVWTNGCFDLFHVGHLHSLKLASDLGDILIVGINSDKSVQANKGSSRPIISEEHRWEIVSSFPFVNASFLFDDPDPREIVSWLRPDIFVKGADWKDKDFPERAIVESYGGCVEFVPLLEGVSTTGIIDRIFQSEQRRRSYAREDVI